MDKLDTTDLKIIYPSNLRKWPGTVYQRKDDDKWRVVIKSKDYKFDKTMSNRDDAEKLLREKVMEYRLKIKNLIFPILVDGKVSHYEVELTKNKRMKIDECDLELINLYIVSVTQGYACTTIKNRTTYVHNLIMRHTPGNLTVDHINRDKLDNRRCNLRLATITQQMTNRFNKNNKSGIRGVCMKGGNRWVAQWLDHDGKRHTKSFSINKYGVEESKALATKTRDEAIKNNPHYLI